jgi:putative SOS response-associated peptidase YedK
LDAASARSPQARHDHESRVEVKAPRGVRHRDGKPFAFAGLWDRWRKGPDWLQAIPVSTHVNNPPHEDAACVTPIAC